MTELKIMPIISLELQSIAWFIVGCLFLLSVNKTQYTALMTTPARQTGLFACTVVMALLWRIKAGILPGLELHILGVTAITLILGWRQAILSASLATLLLVAFKQITVTQLLIHLLLSAYLPILLSYAFFILCYSLLPRHFFVYVFVCAFICAAIIACLKILSISLFYYFTLSYNWFELTENYLYLCAIIWFPEAMLNGMAITLLITYRPQWVKTFYDKDYLDS